MNSADVRTTLIDALRLDLIGPGEKWGGDGRVLGDPHEILPQRPSTWYLTGFLVPLDAGEEQRKDEQSTESLDEMTPEQGGDDGVTPEAMPAQPRYLPSSVGISFLVPPELTEIDVSVRWGDYKPCGENETRPSLANWQRIPKEESQVISLTGAPHDGLTVEVPRSDGLQLAYHEKPVQTTALHGELPEGTRSVSVFLVNRRNPAPDEVRDTAFAFQVQLEIHAQPSITPRPNLCGDHTDDVDERIADLQYRDAYEFAVGHNIASEAVIHAENPALCQTIRTVWIPQAAVERVAPSIIEGVELKMDHLAGLRDEKEASERLGSLPQQYRQWIEGQRASIPSLNAKRRETAQELLHRAEIAAARIEEGINQLHDPDILEAFRIANRAMAAAARQRFGVMEQKDPATVVPAWRPFQLAFVLMNIAGLADSRHPDRAIVDLLFFPTGGGKTEAYLGLAAFTLVYRRLKNPGIQSAGLSVLMRYTLRLLTLDQLSRAATVVCALELERQQDVEKLGPWPFEIGLWVGKAATPNTMGYKGDGKEDTARVKTNRFKSDSSKPSPIPLENCPWCGQKFGTNSFNLVPNENHPTDLRIVCMTRGCAFTQDNPLPIVTVDEPIYRRLPCFMIATVDKFAAMPWTGAVGKFFGRVARYDKNGFYGPGDQAHGQLLPDGLQPPDLIIQDELHLISGPLGTIAGLYETALDALCTRNIEGQTVRPKIVASTATVRRAEKQIRALFNHGGVDIFPPPGPDRRHSFFAETHDPSQSEPRIYVGIAAPGRSPKMALLRTYLVLLATAQKAWERSKKQKPNPADPYMTLLGYFNSLRELGGGRRIVEDEIKNRLAGYGSRQRVNESEGLFADRDIQYEVLELTSRVSTNQVAEAKRRLALTFHDKKSVDVALATNMISVGLDITRLGLMVVFGQPKTSAEYIQTTSRVGRDDKRPGLVVTLLNIHRPRDRSHYERFTAYHESFYRAVEATSVTPFSARAMDRALAGALVGLARLGHPAMTPPRGAEAILQVRNQLDFVVETFMQRAENHANLNPHERDALRLAVRDRCKDLLDEWSGIVHELHQKGIKFQYQAEIGGAKRLIHEFLNPELEGLATKYKKFCANRSMRDVEPEVNLWLKTLEGEEVEQES
ncbi:MAG: DISARM system helicase DrmA [bacterium]|jgi:hypothetical protein|nr:DISARM system helicase DrmA [bacterium]